MNKFFLASMVAVALLCSCNDKTKGAGGDSDSTSLSTEQNVIDGNQASEDAQKNNAAGFVIEENGVENLRLGMKQSQILKSVAGLYSSFTSEVDEVDDYTELYFKGENGHITARLNGDGEINYLAFYIPDAVSSDGKLKVGMPMSEAIASGSYTFVCAPYSPIWVEAKGSHFSFELDGEVLTKATQNIFDEREGEDVVIKARPDMVKPSAKLTNIAIK